MCWATNPALAQADGNTSEALAINAHYIADAIYVAQGERSPKLFMVHDAEVSAEVKLDRWIGTSGTTLGLHALATAGGRPNDAAGTLQGVDNVEVSSHRLKLYQAWLEQAFAGGRGSFRLGLTDLNADFYQNDSAGVLLAPAFGIGSELAATGPNGPSIFPSTALTARVSVAIGKSGYARAAVVDAKAGVLGDPDGVDFSMRHGALVIGEAGLIENGKIGFGVWRYTQRQNDIRTLTPDGSPAKRIAGGAYIIADQKIGGTQERPTNAFVRIGVSEGKTTPFRGGFQAGILMSGPFKSRPDGQLSFGVQQGILSRGFRRTLLDDGFRTARMEWGIEVTYADKVHRNVTLQPDVQYVRRAYSPSGGRDTVVLGIRMILSNAE
ncbi:carbohydrate-selective porin, OprB family [Sphingomonas mucosissima]|uniref:Carbohydrate-selective porin, OprB family n=2 Tax=Sphingomonas mucosissima TaxID=370959 RepID=A0A245ZJQ8_9SPHN|nr:carbohydrate-selective porin, OprB family [Sphingomonas mucosissima]